MNCLDDILAHKRREVAEREKTLDLEKLRERITPRTDSRSFENVLSQPHGIALIAEIKRASPSAGLIRRDFSVTELARGYEQGGAHALSILTDERFFKGQLKYVLQARAATRLPCLRKEFIVSEYQIWEARLAEADAILLIVAALTPDELRHFRQIAFEAELDVLVEAHDEKELDIALESGARLIGINNRNLQTFKTDLAVTERLAPRIPKDCIVVAESGIRTPEDVRRIRAAGAKAMLVGESLMRQPDVTQAVKQLLAGNQA
ncbi:MAG: indole-3-glycerol phosphate synthase TrpC [Verrucomicrobiae bacterium]|nr:indole-3-glycerol phosphate synthase TrpC [Verrucomicrobiae bacterium]